MKWYEKRVEELIEFANDQYVEYGNIYRRIIKIDLLEWFSSERNDVYLVENSDKYILRGNMQDETYDKKEVDNLRFFYFIEPIRSLPARASGLDSTSLKEFQKEEGVMKCDVCKNEVDQKSINCESGMKICVGCLAENETKIHEYRYKNDKEYKKRIDDYAKEEEEKYKKFRKLLKD